MNQTIAKLAAQALLGRRRFWLLLTFPVLVLALTVLVTVLTDAPQAPWLVIGDLGYGLVLPLVAVLAASSVLGPEVDDGSVVYLLAKPVSRHRVAISKWVVAWVATMLAGALPLLVAGLVAGGGDQALGWGLAAAAGGTAYSALFLMISALTRHAVVVSLIFVLIWEALLGGFLSGIAWLSIGQWGVEIGHAASSALPSPVTMPWALVAAAAVTAGTVWFTGDRLRSFTMRGDE